MLGDHKTIDAFKHFYEKPDMTDDELREEMTKHFILAGPKQRADVLASMDAGLDEAADLRQTAQLVNQQRFFRDLHVGLKSRNR